LMTSSNLDDCTTGGMASAPAHPGSRRNVVPVAHRGPLRVGLDLPNLPSGFVAVETRKLDVHENEIGPLGTGFRHSVPVEDLGSLARSLVRVAYKNHALGRSRFAASQRPLAGSNKASAHELVTLEVQDVHLARFGSWDASCALLHIESKSWGARKPPQGGWC
jgi:hypothetical protein